MAVAVMEILGSHPAFAAAIMRFITNLRVCDAGDAEHGITWLELALYFEVITGVDILVTERVKKTHANKYGDVAL